jgi:4-carboxymuconolactone decarboxylase
MADEPTAKRNAYADIAPALGEYTDKVLFGDVWNGITKDELIELITHLAFYSGWPTANSAVAIARKVFAEPAP